MAAEREAKRRITYGHGFVVGHSHLGYLRALTWKSTVNTRCIHLPITSTGSSDEDLTLVPLIDLINHSSDSPRTCQFEPIYTRGVGHGLPGAPCAPQSVILRSPASFVVNAGDEILLRYGHHCNTALFAEYGFILDRKKDSDPAEISLDFIVEPLLHPYGLRELLQRWDYWL